MEIKGVTQDQLQSALDTINAEYAHNIVFKRLDPLNRQETRWSVTLTVVSSKAPGSKRRYNPFTGKTRRIAAACWHVHGKFMDALPESATIRTMGRVVHPGDRWHDWNIGGVAYPQYFSEACECEE